MDAARRRVAALFVIALGLLASALSSRDAGLGKPTFSFFRPAAAERYVVDVAGHPVVADRAAPDVADSSDLRAAIERALPPGDLAHASVVVRRLSDGRGVSIEGDREFYAASTFKLAVLFALERSIARGEIDHDGLLRITAADAAEDLGTLGSLPLSPDGTVPIAVAAEAMIARSDNAVAVAFLHRIGAAKVNAELRSVGVRHMDVNDSALPVTAWDLARLMEAILRGDGVGSAEREEMRTFLLAQLTRDGIPAGVPPTVPIGNKTGTWEGITHDVAFVDAPSGTYVIAVLTDEGWNWERIARISRAVYETLAAKRASP